MSISAAVAISVSKPWFFVQTSHLLNARTVALRVQNVCFPLLPAPLLLAGRAVRLQHLDAVAPASLEPPNSVGGAALHLRNTLLDSSKQLQGFGYLCGS